MCNSKFPKLGVRFTLTWIWKWNTNTIPFPNPSNAQFGEFGIAHL